MVLFLLTFLLLYGGLHAYAFFKIRAAFQPSPLVNLCLILLLALMLLAPLLIRYFERAGLEVLARGLSHVGYCWMGFLLLFSAASLAIDIYRLFVLAGGMLFKQPVAAFLPSPKLFLLIPLAVALAAGTYGYWEALNIHTERIEIRTGKLPPGLDRLRIVQISDVHVGLIIRAGRLERMTAAVREAGPDILISTGDLVDGQLDHIIPAIGQLKSISAKYGKYAITGNHEFYAGLDNALAFTRGAGFTMLRNEAVSVAGTILLVGMDDMAEHGFGPRQGSPERALLKGLPRDRFTILLKHKPWVEKESAGRFDLQLSGHTHKGQLFPFSLITRLFFTYHAGNYDLPGGGLLHVSRGTGTWGPPIRLGAPPEITIIDLVRVGSPE